MHFTKSQMNEIMSRMATSSVRDSDLEEVSELTGDEYIAIVQNGELKKVSLNMIADFILGEPESEVAL